MEPQSQDQSQNHYRMENRIIYNFAVIVIVGIIGLILLGYILVQSWSGEEIIILEIIYFVVVMVLIGYRKPNQILQDTDHFQNQIRRENRIIHNILLILVVGIVGYLLFLSFDSINDQRFAEVAFILGIFYFVIVVDLFGDWKRIQISQDLDQSQIRHLRIRRIIYLFLAIIFAGIVNFLLYQLSNDYHHSGFGDVAFILGIIYFIRFIVIGYGKHNQIPQDIVQTQSQHRRKKRIISLFLKILFVGIAGFLLFFLFEFLISSEAPGEAFFLWIILCIGVVLLIGFRKRIQMSYRKRTARNRVNWSLRYAKTAQIQEELRDFSSARKEWQRAEKLLIKVSKRFPDYVTREYLIQNLGVIKKKIGITYISQGMQIQQWGWKYVQKGDLKKAKKSYYRAITIIEDAVRYIHNTELQESSFTFPISIDLLNEIIRYYRQNSSYFQKDSQLKKSSKNSQNIVDLSEFHQKIYDSIQEFNNVLWIYDQVLRTMETSPAIEEISLLIEQKISKILNLLSNVQERTQILYNYTRTMGKSNSDTKMTGESFTLPSIAPTSPVDQEVVETRQLKLIREYEFIGGRIRFKVGIQNQTGKVMTNLALRFDLPDSLIWVIHEPNYNRRGDTLHIPKLGGHEKLAISLYLEPINCLDSVINATLTYFDADDHPNALVMPSKPVSISCPIFFTREDANLARVKNLSLELKIKDRKIFPLSNKGHAEIIYNKLLETVGKHDVKLVTSEFNPTTQNGEAWFYGITKIKKQKMVIWISMDSSRYVLELTVWGDDQEQITGLLAELEGQLRQSLLLNHIIDDSKKFNEISTSILLGNCPYCAAPIAPELLQVYQRGDTIQCKYCDKSLSPY